MFRNDAIVNKKPKILATLSQNDENLQNLTFFTINKNLKTIEKKCVYTAKFLWMTSLLSTNVGSLFNESVFYY